MYTVSRGPSKLAAQRRRGPTQNLEKVSPTSPTFKDENWNAIKMSSPRPVFTPVNGKKKERTVSPVHQQDQTPEHQYNIRYLYDIWRRVEREEQEDRDKNHGTKYYVESEKSNPALENFVPFDLEQFWANKFLQSVKEAS
ncbi:MAPK regulated corepressor interacting protein 2-like [Branchiostoma floridae]|uniref:MAPK regulated corepressor interacting protein 2-like n=1 Tax=Branchiostoma floridae TaxID=7739 RepID=A0A9J7M6I4_BRAFL|nr:MAPK regulated corepressor interacting protein 2-like [Branchiostoma floridae]